MREDLEETRTALKERDEEFKNLQEEYDSERHDVEERDGKIDKLENQLENAQEAKRQRNTEVTKLRKAAKEKDCAIVELEKEAAEQREINVDLQSELDRCGPICEQKDNQLAQTVRVLDRLHQAHQETGRMILEGRDILDGQSSRSVSTPRSRMQEIEHALSELDDDDDDCIRVPKRSHDTAFDTLETGSAKISRRFNANTASMVVDLSSSTTSSPVATASAAEGALFRDSSSVPTAIT